MEQKFSNNIDPQKRPNLLLFKILVIIGVIIIVIGFLLLTSALLYQIKNVKTPAEFDEWYDSSVRNTGDTILVKGTLDEKEDNPLGSGYAYRFEGSDNDFYSGEDIGNKGDVVLVEIEFDRMNLPTAIGYSTEYNYLILPTILIIIGIIILLIGYIKKRKLLLSK